MFSIFMILFDRLNIFFYYFRDFIDNTQFYAWISCCNFVDCLFMSVTVYRIFLIFAFFVFSNLEDIFKGLQEMSKKSFMCAFTFHFINRLFPFFLEISLFFTGNLHKLKFLCCDFLWYMLKEER